jgi:hypothetical protein
MVIYGVSQSSGVERELGVERVEQGISLCISDHAPRVERDRIVVPAADLVAAIKDRPEGGSTITGAASAAGPLRQLVVAFRRNEVQLRTSGEGEWDVAVGMDDFLDALEGVVVVG